LLGKELIGGTCGWCPPPPPEGMINYSSRLAARGGGFVKIDYLNKINGHYRGVQTLKDSL
jgi:hypothetical protein